MNGLTRQTSKKKGPPQDMLPLYSGVLVPRAFHDELHQHVRTRLPDLKYGEPLKAKNMVARNYYATQSMAGRRLVSHGSATTSSPSVSWAALTARSGTTSASTRVGAGIGCASTSPPRARRRRSRASTHRNDGSSAPQSHIGLKYSEGKNHVGHTFSGVHR